MATRKPKLKVPAFASEKEEAEWWERVRFSEHAESPVTDRTRQRKIPPEERRPTYAPPISIRFEPSQVGEIKQIAAKRGTNYQSLIKLWVAERLALERGRLALNPDVARSLDDLKAELDRTVEERVGALIAALLKTRVTQP